MRPLSVLAFLVDFPRLEEIIAGDRIRTFELLTNLADLGVEINVVRVGGSPPTAADRAHWRDRGIEVDHLATSSWPVAHDIGLFLRSLRTLRRWARRADARERTPWLYQQVPIDILFRGGLVPWHANPAGLLLPVAEKLGVRTWATVHDVAPDHQLSSIERQRRSGHPVGPHAETWTYRAAPLIHAEFGAAVRHADLVTVVSAGMKRLLADRYTLDSCRVVVATTAANPSLVEPIPDWRVPEARPWRIAYLGSPYDADLNEILDALDELAENPDCPPIELHLGLRGVSEDRFRDHPYSVVIDSSVRYADFDTFARGTDIWVLAHTADDRYSWNLGSQTKLPLCAASGRPLVVTATRSVQEDGLAEFATLAEPSAKGLASAIRSVMTGPQSALARAMAGRSHILKARTWHDTAETLLEELTGRS